MEIINIKVMRGPNYWSASQHKLIAVKLDIGSWETLSAEQIRDFYDRLLEVMPSLKSSRFRELEPAETAELQHDHQLIPFIEQMALELQRLADLDCLYGSTYGLGDGVYKIVFSYCTEEAGIYAANAAIECARALLEHRSFDVNAAVQKIEELNQQESLGPSTQAIVDEAASRGIPYARMNEESLIRLGYGRNQKLFRATVVETTGSIAVDMVASKWMTKSVLEQNGIPVPKGVVIETVEELAEAVREIGFPLVVKPIDGNHGRGITTGITSQEAALEAFQLAKPVADEVIVESYVEGDDYRFLVINYKLIAVAKRTPAMVTGDGTSTIRQLIEQVNNDPERGEDHEQVLTAIKIDHHTLALLEEAGLTIDSVIPEGQEVHLKRTANLSTGGTATDMTDVVHPDNVFMAERIARLMHLDVCGIDIMAKDVTTPIALGNGAIIEVNAGPGFRMHTHPSEGRPRNVAKPVIDMLFPDNAKGRIPIVAITGTNGKTTTTRLVAHIAKHAGLSAGFTTTDGIYINDQLVYKGDCSGPKSAEVVLGDPTVNFAVLECARGGILRSGLAFDQCDVSIVTNMSEDHLGLGDIHTLEQYTRVKEVVPKSTAPDGFAILNADDERVLNMKDQLSCNVILFSTEPDNPGIEEHCANGGQSIVIENGYYVIRKGNEKTHLIAVNDIPLTYSGSAEFMVKNILPAIGASIASGFSLQVIKDALQAFKASPESTPGRMNLFDFGDFKLMLDYAHNAAGFLEIEKYMSTVQAEKKVCIIAATGDRKDDDIFRQGEYAARIFDEIIIRHDKDARGRSNEEMTSILQQGIHSVDPDKPVTVISDEYEATKYAVDQAEPDSFIFACADNVWDSISLIEDLQKTAN
jgi:cyanophycin synthetase